MPVESKLPLASCDFLQDFLFPHVCLGNCCPNGIDHLLALVHLSFQNCNRLVVIVYQWLTSQNVGCFKSRDAICCTLATNHFPRSPRVPVSQAVSSDYETEQPYSSESAGVISPRTRKLNLETASRTWRDRQ